MRRRQFITMRGGAAAWPLTARAQQPVMPVIGVLSSRSLDDSKEFLAAFGQGLNEAGFLERQNVATEYRWVENQLDRLPTLAAELARRQVAVILAIGGAAPALAAKTATSTIPVVFIIGGDPVQLGLVASLNRPGGNVTGVTILSGALTAKRLELLRELSSWIRRGRLSREPEQSGDRDSIDRHPGGVSYDRARNSCPQRRQRPRPRYCICDARPPAGRRTPRRQRWFLYRPARAARRARSRHAIPAMYFLREFAAAGGLMSYGNSLADAHHQVGIYTARILRGAKPADLPVQQAVKIELAINLKTAKTLGLDVPTTLLLRANEVIE